jgi:hypothetical protein
MATYLPNITDIFPEPVNYEPDFNFFDKMLQKKQALYDQGVARAKSSFDSVLNAPLSDKANIPLRDEYIKKAKEELKKISASDFSMPENVASAQSIFSPFWDDQFMLKDSALTKWYQAQAQKLTTWRDDNDPKTKEQYSGIAMMYLNNGLEKLQNAGRNPDTYSKIEKREAIPFTNIQKYLEEEATKQKLEVKWDEQSPDGGYLISTKNGERSKQKFKTWAESVIGNNFYEQFRVTGIVEKEQRFKNLRKSLPNLTDEQALDVMSKDVITELDQGYKKRQNSIDVERSEIMGILKSMPATMTEQQKNFVDKLNQDLITLEGKEKALNTDYKYFNQTDKNRITDALRADADSYFATLARQRLVDNWATGKASIENKEIKENSAFFSAQNLQMRKAEYNRNVSNDAWQKQKDIWDQNNKLTELNQKDWELRNPKPTGPGTTGTGKTKIVKDANGNDVVVPDLGEDVFSTGRYIGLGTTGDITATATTAAGVYNKRMTETYLSAHDMIFDTKGLLYVTKSGLNLTDAEIASISSALKNEVRANYDKNSPDYNFTSDQNRSVNKLTKALENSPAVQNAGIKLNGPTALRNAIIAYGQDYFNKRLELGKEGNDVPLNQNEFGAMMSYLTSVQNLDTYNSNEANRQELIKKVLKTNPDYKNITIDRNGEKDFINANDLANGDFKKLGGVLEKNNSVPISPITIPGLNINVQTKAKDLTALKLAEAYINGDLKINYFTSHGSPNAARSGGGPDQAQIVYDGETYSVPSNLVSVVSGILNKYGQSEEFAAKISKANEEVVPDLLFYRDRTGKLGTEWSYTFDKKKQEDKSFNILNEALSPANADYYGADGKPLDTETIAALKALLQNKEENVEKYIQGFTYKTLGIGGKQTISFNIGEISAETKQQIAGVNLDQLNQQEYSLVISPTATGPTLTSLPNSTGMYVYQNLLRGTPMKCDPVIAASGFDFTATPNTDGSVGANGEANTPTAVTVNLKYNVRENVTDPKTKQLTSVVKQKSQDIDIPLVGPNSKSPDEIINYLYEKYYELMVANRNTQQQYQQYLESPSNPSNAVNPTTGQPVADKPTTYDRDKYFRDNGIIIK